MKKLLLTLTAVFVSFLTMGQTETKNYVYTTAYQVETHDGETKTENGQQVPLTPDDKIETITYYDGLGRPEQSVAKQAGGNKQDIITPMVYDYMGRQSKTYLPYANPQQTSGMSLDYRDPSTLIDDLDAYYVSKYPNDLEANAPNPYSETYFEPSPLNRVLKQGAPGEDWKIDPNSSNDHTIRFDYQTNLGKEVEHYSVIFPTGNTEEPFLFYNGYYEANQLYKTITKDENHIVSGSEPTDNSVSEFKNKKGQIVLKRTYNNKKPHDTYYVYDDYGNLTYVLSPKGSDLVLYGFKPFDFSNSIEYVKFVPLDSKTGIPLTTGSGGANVTIDDNTNVLTVGIDISLNDPIVLRNGPIAQLNSNIPDVVVGTLDGYTISVLDGYLYVVGDTEVSNFTGSFSIDLPDHVVDYQELDDLCYQYHYDDRNRLIEKKIPGKGWEFIVYNTLDKPVLTQDANLRATDDWLFTKYDVFGRVVYTGKHHFVPPNSEENSGRKTLQDVITSQGDANFEIRSYENINGVVLYHSNKIRPKVNIEVYTINYYDTYPLDITGGSGFDDPGSIVINGETVQTTSETKTLSTGSRVRVLGTDKWIKSVSYYDDKARPIYTAVENDYLNTFDKSVTAYDFVGKVMQTETTHVKDGNSPIKVTDTFVYDHAGRLLSQKQKINSQPQEQIVKNHYDELGQLKSKDVGGNETSSLQTVDYAYNIRGWLKDINDVNTLGNDLFGFKINYNTKELGSGNQKLYNGNISETIWRTANDVVEIGQEKRGYAYKYDALNRLFGADYGVGVAGNYNLGSGYDERTISYDKNGNILALTRVAGPVVGNIDNLLYKYDGNQLTEVKDLVTSSHGAEGFNDGNTSGTDYGYDVNGNMVQDKNKGIIGITYNHLNLPTNIDFDLNHDGEIDSNNKIKYVYDATGVKLEKQVLDGGEQTFTRYAGNYIYEETVANGEELKFFNHPEGYVEPNTSGGFNYVYQYKDHLGNIRLSYKVPSGEYESLVNSTFYEEYDGWLFSSGAANGSIEVDNERLVVNAKNQYNGAYIVVGDDFSSGDDITLEFDVDKGNTNRIRAFFVEKDASNNLVGYYNVNYDIATGHYVFNHTIGAGTKLMFKVDKSNLSSDVGTMTYFYVDNVYAKKGRLEIVEENNYYPFGLKHKGYNSNINGVDHPYGFNGKEEQNEFNGTLQWLDFGARNYDPALGRWMNLDPLAEKMRRHSPYNYAFDNPIYFIDYDGMMPTGPWPNPFGGIGKQIARAFRSKVNGISNSVSKGWSNTKSAVAGWFSSDSSEKSTRGGFDFGDGNGQSGAQDTKDKGSRETEYKDVGGAYALAAVAGGKKASNGDGMTNATDLSKKNAANSFADGVDAVSDVGNAADAIDAIPNSAGDGGSIETTNTNGEVSTSSSQETITITNVRRVTSVVGDNKAVVLKTTKDTIINSVDKNKVENNKASLIKQAENEANRRNN